MSSRDEKIQQLADLLSGKIAASDLKPKSMCLMIGWSLNENGTLTDGIGDDNLYLIDGKTADREAWNQAMINNKTDKFIVTYGGREDAD